MSDPSHSFNLVVGAVSTLGALGLVGWYLYRDHTRHRHTKAVRALVQRFTQDFRTVSKSADDIWSEWVQPLLPLFELTDPVERAAALAADYKRADKGLGVASELLLRQLESMDGVPLRKLLEPVTPDAVAAGYEPSAQQQEALAKLKDKRRHLARHLNQQLAKVDTYHTELKQAV
ncbi:hypothetical protein IWQ60_002942 [Tieghemiomyces parasiticus]|uniref:Uncharacterized protein n=1 Tax=Tieghemiomyces parasiticus TaxID=78921 RepID=A0A9W8DWY1_9FUNG|nr:hypothetical protein IWQ60_002942 [Tieghemiomyces parasiticus]